MDSNPKISSDQILNKSVSIIPDPNNLHENNSPSLADFIPKISSDEMLNKSIPIISDSQNPDSISNSNIEKSSPTNPPNPSQPSQPTRTSPFALTYSRRKIMPKTGDVELPARQEFDPGTGNELDINDLDIPIALRNGPRRCTQHPISKFLTYSHLSKLMQALVSHLSKIETPNNVEKALQNNDWKAAVFDGMNELNKMESGRSSISQVESLTWDVNGFS